MTSVAPSSPQPPEPPVRTQSIVTLDLEGVLVPEVWIAVAERTAIDELRRTTRDEPDYDTLMRYRLDILEREGLTLGQITGIIGEITPLAGAIEFLDRLRDITQVIILSDTFEQFAAPLMRQLGHPTIMCHRLITDDDRIVGYRLRQHNPKQRAVEALQSLGYRVIAAGDSYNDISMLQQADHGVLFRSPPNVRADHPRLPACDDFAELLSMISDQL